MLQAQSCSSSLSSVLGHHLDVLFPGQLTLRWLLALCPAALPSEGPFVLPHVVAGSGAGPFFLPRATALLSEGLMAASWRSPTSPSHLCFQGAVLLVKLPSSQRMAWAGRSLQRPSSPPPCHGQGHLALDRSLSPLSTLTLNASRSPSFSGHPLAVSHHPLSTTLLSYVQPNPDGRSAPSFLTSPPHA